MRNPCETDKSLTIVGKERELVHDQPKLILAANLRNDSLEKRDSLEER